jgi:hypothetical protein
MMTISVQVSTRDNDPEEIDRLIRQFRQELLELDVHTATLARKDDIPPGAKGDPTTVGTLIVTLANSTVLVSLCQLIRAWATRDRRRSDTVKIIIKNGEKSLEITGDNPAQHRKVIDTFLKTYNQT